MKRLIALCLVLLMITASASAADWGEGLSPNQPFANQPAVDFDKTIGHMMFYPNARVSESGTKTLFIYLPREDVEVGTGHLTIRSADQGEEFRTAMNDTTYVTQRAMTEDELGIFFWGSGTCIEIELPVGLRVGTSYFADMEVGCIGDRARDIWNPAFSGEGVWQFDMIADYGVNAVEFRRANGNDEYEGAILRPQAGDEVRFDLVLGGDALSASVIPLGDVSFSNSFFTEGGEIVGTVTGDAPSWQVIFWDTETAPLRDESSAHTVYSVTY